jgi:hypothetical protein
MARKRRVITEEEPIVAITMPADGEYEKAVKRLATMQKTVTSASGDMGEFVNKLCESKDFDKRALGIVRRLQSLPNEKFRITWKQIVHAAAELGFDERADEQPELFDVDDDTTTNVRRMRAPRQVEEEAVA